jgi:hypothetical protein
VVSFLLRATNQLRSFNTNPWESFAEAFAGYVHSVLLRRPFKVELRKGRKLERSIEACWDQPRCLEKRHFFEQLLKPKF